MTPSDATDLDGRVLVVTGGTSGIGRHAALSLADRGATVAVVGRDAERGRSVVEAAADGPGEVAFHRADLAAQSDVRDLADELLASYDAVHALANNAGLARSERAVTDDGVELTLAVNHLAPYLLTYELLPRLRESARNVSVTARVVTTASELHHRDELDFEDLQFASGYDGLDAYARSKLANVAFTIELADRLDAADVDEVVANCFSPGFVRGTRIWTGASWRSRLLTWIAALAPGVGTDVETGGGRLVDLLAAPEYGDRSGAYVDEGAVREPGRDARDPAIRERLWERSAALVGVDPDWPTA